ncbi:MAG: DUF493 domain-containing protein [Deltaproteobacteria bacterium]|nr:DUF493 domain-containing protein [Deltaproteobacteria bacterium]
MSEPTPDPQRPTAVERQQALKRLEEHHDFPCVYMFKVIGYNSGELAQEVRRAAETVLGPIMGKNEIRSRPSSGDKYLAVTIETKVESSAQVLDVYDALKALEGLIALV